MALVDVDSKGLGEFGDPGDSPLHMNFVTSIADAS